MPTSKSLVDQISGMEAKETRTRREQELAAQLRAAERVIAEQQNRIERLNKKRFALPKQKKQRPVKGTFVRVVIPDTHGCFIDPAAELAFLADLEALAPREIVMIGDHIDCGGFLAQHHVWGYVAETSYTFQDDIDAGNAFLDRVQAAAPKATIHYLEGNHEQRIEKWCVTAALRSNIDAAYLLKMHGTEAVLNLKERGIHFYKQGQFYMGLRVPATIRLGRCYFTHGTKHGKSAAAKMLQRFGAPVVFGHVHKLLAESDRNVHDGELGAWCCGYLGRAQPLWRHSDPTDWTQGYGVQLVRPNGDFLHINTPIIDGKSYLVNSGFGLVA